MIMGHTFLSMSLVNFFCLFFGFYQPVPYAFLNSVPKYQEEFEDNVSFKVDQEAWQEVHERSKEDMQSCLNLKLFIVY